VAVAGPGGQGPPPSSRRNVAVWVVLAVAFGAMLVVTKRITEAEIIIFCVLVPSIILHEIAHGWVALAFGDDTARRAGRLSFNPIVHIDPVGTVIVPAILALSGLGLFGWAKPVPVNVSRLRHQRDAAVVVSLAGPATNVVLTIVAAVVFRRFGGAGTLVVTVTGAASFGALWAEVVFFFGLVNIWLAAFNMIPAPPLDGSVLFERCLPNRWWPGYLRFRRYTLPILFGVVLISSIAGGGPLAWFYDHLFNWWAARLGI
jgi:Zn-dependent protease